MNKTIKEMATELSQYFEEGNVQKIVSLLNDCNKDELFDKARYSVGVHSQGILQVNEPFANETDFDDLSMNDKVAKLTECIRQERWEECIDMATKNHDCAWGKHPAIKQTIESKINEIKSNEIRGLLADAMKETEVSESESEPDDFDFLDISEEEKVKMYEEDFELAKERKEGFVMVGKSDGALDKLNISNHLKPGLSK